MHKVLRFRYIILIYLSHTTLLYLLRLAMNCLPAQLFFSTIVLLSCKIDMVGNLASSI